MNSWSVRPYQDYNIWVVILPSLDGYKKKNKRKKKTKDKEKKNREKYVYKK